MCNKTMILAHRGFAKKYPENTMLAFKKASEYKIAGFETDVQRTLDGELVLIHDEEISRVSNGKGFVWEHNLKELKTLDFRNGMTEYELNAETRIPTLTEFLTWLKTTKLVANLELKSSRFAYSGMTEKVIKTVKNLELTNRIIISSFNHKDVVLAKKLCPEIKCGFLTSSVLLNPGKYTKQNGADYYHPEFRAMRAEDWNECKKLGIQVNPYTVDSPKDINEVAKFGAFYIITNDPETAAQVLDKF